MRARVAPFIAFCCAVAVIAAADVSNPGASGKTMPSVRCAHSTAAPCDAFPALNAMHEEFAPKGVEILAISVDERWRDLDAFRREIASLLEQAGD